MIKKLILLIILLGCKEELKLKDNKEDSKKVIQVNTLIDREIKELGATLENLSQENTTSKEELKLKDSKEDSKKVIQVNTLIDREIKELGAILENLNQENTTSRILFKFNSNMKEMLEIIMSSLHILEAPFIEYISSDFLLDFSNYKFNVCSLREILYIMNRKNLVLLKLLKINSDENLILMIQKNREELNRLINYSSMKCIANKFNLSIENINSDLEDFMNYLKFYDRKLYFINRRGLLDAALIYAIESKSLKLIDAILDRGASLDKKIEYIKHCITIKDELPVIEELRREVTAIEYIEFCEDVDRSIYYYLSLLKVNKELNNSNNIDKFIIDNVKAFNNVLIYFTKDSGFDDIYEKVFGNSHYSSLSIEWNFNLNHLIFLNSQRDEALSRMKELNDKNELKLNDSSNKLEILYSINKELKEYLNNELKNI